MGFLLDCFYVLAGVAVLPFVLVKMAMSERWREGVWERLGGVRERKGAGRCVWVHAVSVGEVMAARGFVEGLRRVCPDVEVVVSTMTNTGQKVARDLYGTERCFYFPLDVSCAVRRAFRRVRPDVVVLVELEIWPNFARVARGLGVPVAIVNGRMREERVGRYRALRFLFRPLYEAGSGNVFCVQNETYRDRFARAGFPAERVRVTGNMKYDAAPTEMDEAGARALRQGLGIGADERVWVAGCTWPGEEEICLRVHRLLLAIVPGLRLVIAPRHVERAAAVARVVEDAGFGCRLRSAGESGGTGAGVEACRAIGDFGENQKGGSVRSPQSAIRNPFSVCVLDTVGELGYCYSFAEFCFVGKSLTSAGGHNMLEPAGLGAPPVFGPRTENFADEAECLLSCGAAVRVADEAELAAALECLLTDGSARDERARKGRDAVAAMRGAGRRNVEVVMSLFSRKNS